MVTVRVWVRVRVTVIIRFRDGFVDRVEVRVRVSIKYNG